MIWFASLDSRPQEECGHIGSWVEGKEMGNGRMGNPEPLKSPKPLAAQRTAALAPLRRNREEAQSSFYHRTVLWFLREMSPQAHVSQPLVTQLMVLSGMVVGDLEAGAWLDEVF